MSDRVIRDELLTSERYWAVSNEAKLLYIHLILNVDDTARFSGKNFTLRTSCFPGQAMEAAHMERMLDELQNNDLIRLYVVDGERYVFVPRFKQRLRFINSRFPEPPNEINDLVIKKSDSSQTKDRLEYDSRPLKLREEKRREELHMQPSVAKVKANHLPKDYRFDEFWDAFADKRGKEPAKEAWSKLNHSDQLVDEIIAGAKRYVEYRKDMDRKKWKMPQGWLNDKRWEDEIITETPVDNFMTGAV